MSYSKSPTAKKRQKQEWPQRRTARDTLFRTPRPFKALATNRTFIIRVPTLGADGMALFPFILVRKPNPSPTLINHERIHLRQQAEMGIVPFYLWYIIEYSIRWFHYRDHYTAYRNISFEREAFANDNNLMYLKTRAFWRFTGYIRSHRK